MPVAHTNPQERRHSRVLRELTLPLSSLSAISSETKIVLIILAVLSLWGLAILTFGVAALVWPMKIIVPGMILGLVLLTRGLQ